MNKKAVRDKLTIAGGTLAVMLLVNEGLKALGIENVLGQRTTIEQIYQEPKEVDYSGRRLSEVIPYLKPGDQVFLRYEPGNNALGIANYEGNGKFYLDQPTKEGNRVIYHREEVKLDSNQEVKKVRREN